MILIRGKRSSKPVFNRFFPDDYTGTVYEIPYGELRERGIKGLIFDVDNTLAPYHIEKSDERVKELFDRLAGDGFKIALLSNNNEQRLLRFSEGLSVAAVAKAGKPGGKGVERAASLMGLSVDSCALIGDQIFTDVWCAKRCGMYSILVNPISSREGFWIKLKRVLEGLIFWRYSLYKSAEKGNAFISGDEKSNIAMKKKRDYNGKGFTLIEVVIALAVAAIFTGAIVTYPFNDKRALDEVCRTLQADLRLAQRLSVIEGCRYSVSFDSMQNLYKVYMHVSNNEVVRVKQRKLEGGIVLVGLTSATQEVEYKPTGSTKDACTITLRDSKYIVSLTVNLGSGRIDIIEFKALH